MSISHRRLRESLEPLAGSLKKIRLSRQTPCAPSLNGYVLGMSDQWLLLWQFHDFYPDGFTIVRMDGITSYRCGEYEEFWTNMLRQENVATELPSMAIDLSSTKSVLRDLQKTDQNFIVESEAPDKDIEDFYLGRATRIQNTQVKFASFDALGQWDTKLQTIEFGEITRLQFDTPYTNCFSRYTDGKCPFPIRYAK
jgi:hypothetical protein